MQIEQTQLNLQCPWICGRESLLALLKTECDRALERASLGSDLGLWQDLAKTLKAALQQRHLAAEEAEKKAMDAEREVGDGRGVLVRELGHALIRLVEYHSDP